MPSALSVYLFSDCAQDSNSITRWLSTVSGTRSFQKSKRFFRIIRKRDFSPFSRTSLIFCRPREGDHCAKHPTRVSVIASLSHCLTLILSQSHSFSFSHSLTLSLPHSLTLSLTLTLSFALCHTHCLAHYHSFARPDSRSISLSISHSLRLSHSLALFLSPSLALSLSDSLTLTGCA